MPLLLLPAHAQVFTFTHDEMLKYTSHNPFERFDDGRMNILVEGGERFSDAVLLP